MNLELISQLASAVVMVWGALAAIRASRSATRTALLSNLLRSVALLLLVRLIADFGGWSSWFIYLWMFFASGYVVAGYLATTAWVGLPLRAESTKGSRTEMVNLGVSGVLTLAVSGALVIPGLMLS